VELKDWILAQEREERWEDYLRRRPVCMDCGRDILEGMVFPLEENGSFGFLCPGCVQDRMIPAEETE